MASFVEQATLLVRDGSTANINKINRALRELFKTARSLKSATANINVNAKGLQQATTGVRGLRKELLALKGVAKNINLSASAGGLRSASAAIKGLTRDVKALHSTAGAVKMTVNTHGIAAAQSKLTALRQSAAQPIKVTTQAAGRLPSAAGGGVGRGAGARDNARTPLHGFGRSFASGLGVSSVVGAFGAVSVAGYAAATALRSIADSAAERDRTSLQGAVAASEAQRKIFKEAGDRPSEATAVSFTKNERDRLRTSTLGDVQGETDVARAKAVVNVIKELETKLLPRLYAQAPEKGHEGAIEGMRKIIQGMNLASTDINDASGNFSKDGLRVLNGIQKAMAADPDLSPALIKSSLANLKTAGYTLDEDSIARVLINAGSRGVRAANEAFQAMRSTGGTIDIKQLNNNLDKMGLITDVKRNEKGNVIAGSGKVKDPELWAQDPATWLQKNYVPGMLDRIKAEGKDPADTVARKNQIEKDFPGMKASGIQGITDMVLGFDQMNAAIAQYTTALQQNVPDAVAKSWMAQADAVRTAWVDAAGGVGDALADKINLAGILETVAAKMRDDPNTALALAGLATAAGGAIGVAAIGAFMAPATALTGSASALTGSAGALSAAAARLGAGSMPMPPGGAPPGGAPGGAPGGTPGGKPAPSPTRTPGRLTLGRGIGIGAVVGAVATGIAARIATATPEDRAKGAEERNRIVAELKDLSREMTGQTETTDQQAKDKANIQKAVADRGLMRQAVDDLKREQASVTRRLEMAKTPEQRDALRSQQGGLDAQMSGLQSSINSLTAALTQQEFKQKPEAAPNWIADALKAVMPTPAEFGDPAKISSDADMQSVASTMQSAASMIQAAIRTQSEFKQQPASFDPAQTSSAAAPNWLAGALNAIKQPTTPTSGFGDPSQTSSASDVQAAASTLQSASSGFSAVFMTGAQAIGASGQTVASTISGAAPGIGATIGAAAAAAIQGAVSNLSINVNANVTGASAGADKGAAKAAN